MAPGPPRHRPRGHAYTAGAAVDTADTGDITETETADIANIYCIEP